MGEKSPDKQPDITQLVLKCQQEDRRAQNMLYDYFKKKMFGICLRYAGTKTEAESIFQDAFVRIFQNIDTLKNPELVSSWVKTVVIRTAINHYHREIKPQKDFTSLDNLQTDPTDDGYLAVISQLEMETLVKLINQLPTGYRMVLNLYLIDGYIHSEISEMLGISEGNSRSQYARGKAALVKQLSQIGLKKNELLEQNP